LHLGIALHPFQKTLAGLQVHDSPRWPAHGRRSIHMLLLLLLLLLLGIHRNMKRKRGNRRA
jgi:membrane protein DedA with SNARE-associated domain